MTGLTEFNVTIFGISLKLNRIAFSIGGIDVYWYGIIIALGFLLAIVYGWKNAKRFNIDVDRMADVVLVTAPMAVLGARAYFLIFYGESFSTFFNFKEGGLAIYGAIIVAFIVGPLMCKLRKIKILDMLDLGALGFLIGQAVGRWGNFFNQEAFGSATGSSWFGMTSENVTYVLGDAALAHPCFLYESLWCVLGFILLHKLSKNRKFSGQVFLSYGVWYGFGRAIIEGFRTDSLYLGSMRISQVISIVACVVCVALIFVLSAKQKEKAKEETVYESQFITDDVKTEETQEETEQADEE